MLKLSRYSFLFSREGQNFLYSSRSNNFYTISPDLYDFLKSNKSFTENGADEGVGNIVRTLREKHILVADTEDDDWVEEQKFLHHIRSFSTRTLSLTIAPTITCNLRCPYCFEQEKPDGIMDDSTIEQLGKYISTFRGIQNYTLSWFGGEPLLAMPQIEKTLVMLDGIEDIKRIQHSIITNGVLLNEKAIELFSRHHLDHMQITFDGFRSNHDSKRFFPNGSGTFDLILHNVERFMQTCSDTHVSFRVNIDKHTEPDFATVANLIQSRFPNGNYDVYPGILRANRGCESETFLTSADHLAFERKVRKAGIRLNSYPSQPFRGCCATQTCSAVIGPRGEIYRCWESVGKKKETVGSIFDEKTGNKKLLREFIMYGHPYNDEKCLQCGLLPICTGGCALKRLQNRNEGMSHDLCTIYSDRNGEGLADLLYEYYLSGCQS